jgi:hypothetical protein
MAGEVCSPNGMAGGDTLYGTMSDKASHRKTKKKHVINIRRNILWSIGLSRKNFLTIS